MTTGGCDGDRKGRFAALVTLDCRAGVLACLLVAAVSLVPSRASAATSGDRAATAAYLNAVYALDRASASSAPQQKALLQRAATRIGSECPDVLGAAPQGIDQSVGLLAGPLPLSKPLPLRSRGEEERKFEQLTTLENELESALRSAVTPAIKDALSSFTTTVSALRWSDPRVEQAVGREIAILHLILPEDVPNACADMRVWVASGYRTLSAATREFASAQEAAVSILLYGSESIDVLLRPYEDEHDRAIRRRSKALSNASGGLLTLARPVTRSLRAKLGLKGLAEPEAVKQETVGRGRTSVGGSYSVTVSPTTGTNHRCRTQVAIDYENAQDETTVERSIGFSVPTGVGCVPHGSVAPSARVECDEGLIEIESRTLARARRVRLQLSDRRTLTSTVVHLPARLGRQAGVYFQIVHGPAPVPIALSELDRDGRVLRVVRLRRVRDCRRVRRPTPIRAAITAGVTPDGTPFTISGLALTLRRRAELTLIVNAGQRRLPLTSEPPTGNRPDIFTWNLETGCTPPHRFTIVYGQLRVAGDVVLARTASGLSPLSAVAIPATLRTAGAVVYGVFTTAPSALVVEDGNGGVVVEENLAHRVQQETEFCEGFAEG